MKILAITDETNTCECCGKRGLKRVVVIELENGAIVRYGTDCASKAFRDNKSQFASATDVLAYVQKWSAKYSAEIVVRGLETKRGLNAKVVDGAIFVYLGNWVRVG